MNFNAVELVKWMTLIIGVVSGPTKLSTEMPTNNGLASSRRSNEVLLEAQEGAGARESIKNVVMSH